MHGNIARPDEGRTPSKAAERWRGITLHFGMSHYWDYLRHYQVRLDLSEVRRLVGGFAFLRLAEELERRHPGEYGGVGTPISMSALSQCLGDEAWGRVCHLIFPHVYAGRP